MPEVNDVERSYKILSLDGGGSWALIQVRTLQKLFEDDDIKGWDVLRQFDLVVANSGGSLTAMALAENWPLSQIAAIFLEEENRRKIFVELKPGIKKIGNKIRKTFIGIGPKYIAKAKVKGLESLLKNANKTLTELPNLIGKDSPHFLIVGFDYDRERATFFRSDRNSKAQTHIIAAERGLKVNGSFDEITVANALHASTNAPLDYFNEPAYIKYQNSPNLKRFWDGAVGGYNNPIMAGITEALSNKISINKIRVISIGTGSDFRPLKKVEASGKELFEPILCQEPDEPGLTRDIKKMAMSILSDPPDAATFTAWTILNNDESIHLVRLNPLIQPLIINDKWVLPQGLNINEFKRLVELDMDAVEEKDVILIEKFCRLWRQDKVPNQPIRSDSELKAVLGFAKFSDALKAAKAILKMK